MRRPVRFFVHEVDPDGTLWLEDGDDESSSVVSVSTYDSMGHGRSCDRRLRVVVMQTGPTQDPREGTIVNDGLKNAIAEAFIADTTHSWDLHPDAAALIAAEAVRAWLALPPSEDEIEAAAKAMWANDRTWADIDPTNHAINVSLAKAALVASRSVVAVRPPEETT